MGLETNHRVIIHDHLSSLEANVEPVTSIPAAPGQSPKSRRNRKWRSSRLAGVFRVFTLESYHTPARCGEKQQQEIEI